ncbi:MAG: translation initiation factor IF-2 [Candidatus Pacebacteria bacterium]|jgi:translation initiation factor IF-2|nr:translation initiation factor IF-2 [Candidatus Paceibacterota bacterium]MDP7159489.1 translation initiation factor IF-2 [Candidatus Paceibacterota bacterium]MDP7367342.1 translation initiation factor IF-2 [Candidatus Paceibacterota bacterium]MDP7466138.1 translation initiation factor IF-2 [Candidatus Paceibacterota bacterium]MDP7648164.1 translation initiation factor IF-2 [Candidatus Paceibacterota bacterium]|tara:strand:- start:881 stop:2368 length:1488 start_codon:yes stop_codon:yes gene_type:complete
MTKEKTDKKIVRPPVIVVMGHIDHGKSALLDYIRKTNIVESEHGGITQHLSAYEVTHKERKITFLDTPGHEAFKKMRFRGAEVADIAVLVVSAEEGVKAQTLEALKSIRENKIPFIVAINKIDKPSADVEKTKQNILENEIYLEGLGGNVPFTPISAKTGEGIPELLDMMLLVADLEELSGNSEGQASGIVIESHLDQKKGISTTLIIKDGILKIGSFIVAGDALSPVRIMEDFHGEQIKEAVFSSPVKVVGFSKIPVVGSSFETFKSKKDAEKVVVKTDKKIENLSLQESAEDMVEIPIILVADVLGTIDAIEHELEKLENERVKIRIIKKSVGSISEDDIKTASGKSGTLVVGFNTKADNPATTLANRLGIEIKVFNVIYKIGEWLSEVIKENTPKIQVEEKTGSAKILKIFSKVKDKQVLGGKVTEGELSVKEKVNILRRGEEVGKGEIVNLQQSKANVKEIKGEGEFGAQIQARVEIAIGDTIEGFIVREK